MLALLSTETSGRFLAKGDRMAARTRTLSSWAVLFVEGRGRYLIGSDANSGEPIEPMLITSFNSRLQTFVSSTGTSCEVTDFGLATLPVRLSWRAWCQVHKIESYGERTAHFVMAIAAYRETLKRVLFLDFDGVLHPDPLQPISGRFSHGKPVVRQVQVERQFVYVDQLWTLLKEVPDVGIVVHSTWRHSRSHLELRELLGPLRFRFLEGTQGVGRWDSIQSWLHDYRRVTDYLVVDNVQHEFPTPALANLLVCPSDEGIANPAVRSRLRAWLNRSACPPPR